MSEYVFGIEGLDSNLGRALAKGVLLVAAGHPGSGKTTLASTVCYSNMLKGHRCLYLSVQEDRDKLFRNAKRLGIDMYSAEEKGLLKFAKLPLVIGEERIYDIYVEAVNRYVVDFSPKIVVVDSVTPILKAVGGDVKARALLQNFFFELPKLINGLAILIAEIPLMEERIEPVDIEFVADIVLIMRHSVAGRLLQREIEIRKARGAPITVARLPFSIIENQGMKVYTPPSLSEVPQPDKDPIFKSVCRGCEWLPHIRAGQFMYITYPLELFPGDYLLITIANAILSGGKLLIVSYEYPPEYIWFMVAETIRAQLGIELPTDEIGESLKNYVSIEAYNPALYSSNDLYLLTLEAIARIRPRIVAILGNPEVVWGESSIEMYSDLIFNLILHFRKLRLVTILISGYLEKSYSIFSRIADLIIRAKTTTSSNESTMLYQIVRKGGRPTIVEDESFAQCVKEAADMLVKMIRRQL